MKIACDYCKKPLGVAAGRPDGALSFCGKDCCWNYSIHIPIGELAQPGMIGVSDPAIISVEVGDLYTRYTIAGVIESVAGQEYL